MLLDSCNLIPYQNTESCAIGLRHAHGMYINFKKLIESSGLGSQLWDWLSSMRINDALSINLYRLTVSHSVMVI